MKRIPDMITCLRMAAALCFLFVKPLSGAFFCLYGAAGLSDILDGWLARRLKTADRRGAVLDSIADLMVAVALTVVLVPVLPVGEVGGMLDLRDRRGEAGLCGGGFCSVPADGFSAHMER